MSSGWYGASSPRSRPRIVLDHDAKRTKDTEHARRLAAEVLTHAVLELLDLDDAVASRDADARAAVTIDFGRVAAAPQPAIVGMRGSSQPETTWSFTKRRLPLAHDGVRQIQPRELDLLRWQSTASSSRNQSYSSRLFSNFERADRVRDAFDRIREAMREVVHGIKAPVVLRAVMCARRIR